MSNTPESLIERALNEARSEFERWGEIVQDLENTLRKMRGGVSADSDKHPAPDFVPSLSDMPATGAAEIVLRRAGKPVHMLTLIRKMAGYGYPVQNERKFYGTLFTAMKRQPDRFKWHKGAKWEAIGEGNGAK